MKTFVLTVLVIQSGSHLGDAKAVLEMNLGEVLPTDDFEVMPVAVKVAERTSLQMTEER
jgi:uncharacterized SAM-binding protein YcdF (DUF218 family)